MIQVKTLTVDDEVFVSRKDLLSQVRDAKIDLHKKAQGTYLTEETGALKALTAVEQALMELAHT